MRDGSLSEAERRICVALLCEAETERAVWRVVQLCAKYPREENNEWHADDDREERVVTIQMLVEAVLTGRRIQQHWYGQEWSNIYGGQKGELAELLPLIIGTPIFRQYDLFRCCGP